MGVDKIQELSIYNLGNVELRADRYYIFGHDIPTNTEDPKALRHAIVGLVNGIMMYTFKDGSCRLVATLSEKYSCIIEATGSN